MFSTVKHYNGQVSLVNPKKTKEQERIYSHFPFSSDVPEAAATENVGQKEHSGFMGHDCAELQQRRCTRVMMLTVALASKLKIWNMRFYR